MLVICKILGCETNVRSGVKTCESTKYGVIRRYHGGKIPFDSDII